MFSHYSHGRIRKYAVGPNRPRYGLSGSKVGDLEFKKVIDSATESDFNHQPSDPAFPAFEKNREKGWGLSGRPDRLKVLTDAGFMWSWNCPKRSDPIRDELEKYGWKAMWVKAPDREWYRQHRKPLPSWIKAQNARPDTPGSPVRRHYTIVHPSV